MKLAAGFADWRPAQEVLTRVRAVPTCFVQYDRATRCGGHPIERFTTVHGPSNHGKTSFLHGLGLSFLRRDHVYAYVDAEYTTPEDWLERLMAEHARHPGFVALRPRTYEQTVAAVRNLLAKLEAGREADVRLADTTALIVVDSVRKLVPENILAKILAGPGGQQRGKKAASVDGMGGRAAQLKAAMNASWLDELTPRLYHARAAMAVVARESEDPAADANDRMYGNDWKMGGGKALEFDASLVIRITRSWVREGEGESARVVGERHRVAIRKTKVAGKTDKVVVCHFHTSNGVLVPEGFDRARDVLELALEYGLVKQAGAWLSWGKGGTRWQGTSAAVRKLHAQPAALDALDAQVRAQFRLDERLPEEESCVGASGVVA